VKTFRAWTDGCAALWLAAVLVLPAPAVAADPGCAEPLHDCCCGPESCACPHLPSTAVTPGSCSKASVPAVPATWDRLRAADPADSVSPAATEGPFDPARLPRGLADHRRAGYSPEIARYLLDGALLI
jgi:hypothetical protein